MNNCHSKGFVITICEGNEELKREICLDCMIKLLFPKQKIYWRDFFLNHFLGKDIYFLSFENEIVKVETLRKDNQLTETENAVNN